MKQAWIGWLLILWSACLWASPEKTESTTTKKVPIEIGDFQKLDAEVEQALGEVLSLGTDMIISQETRGSTPNPQLMVVVSFNPMPFFKLTAIQLLIDKNIVVSHQYTLAELEAMAQGGSHRLFLDGVPDGHHQIKAIMLGSTSKKPDYQREVSYAITSSVGRQTLELNITADKKKKLPELAIKEWK